MSNSFQQNQTATALSMCGPCPPKREHWSMAFGLVFCWFSCLKNHTCLKIRHEIHKNLKEISIDMTQLAILPDYLSGIFIIDS